MRIFKFINSELFQTLNSLCMARINSELKRECLLRKDVLRANILKSFLSRYLSIIAGAQLF